jgi:peptidoglycan/LPS O-acetylase OafA/YrhL
MGRSVLVVIGGYLSMAVVVLCGIILATVAFIPGGLNAAMAPPGPEGLPRNYLIANLIVSFASASVGGWVVRRLAKSSKQSHVLAFIGLMVVMSAVSAMGANPGQPAWYPWVIPVVGIAGAAAGGWRSTNARA